MAEPVHPFSKEELRALMQDVVKTAIEESREKILTEIERKFELYGFAAVTSDDRASFRKDMEFARTLRMTVNEAAKWLGKTFVMLALAGFLALAALGGGIKSGWIR